MADTAAERKRRHRTHTAGDHRLCRPARCPQAPPSDEQPAASGALKPGDGLTETRAQPATTDEAVAELVAELKSVAAAIAADLVELGDLVGIEGSLAAIALRLGRAIDDAEDARLLALLSREARSTLTELTMSTLPRRPPAGESGKQSAAAGGQGADKNDGWSGMDNPV